MKLKLSDHDRNRLDLRVAETEKRTQTQIVLTLIQRSDNYEELPWKAFALGASISGLLLLLLDWWLHDWYQYVTLLITVVGILACGALLALLTVIFPRFAKCFLSDHRAEAEVQPWLDADWLLGQFGKKRKGAIKSYRRFVMEGKGLPSVLAQTRHQLLLGDDSFVERFRQDKQPEDLREVSKAHRQSIALPLDKYQQR